MTASRPTDTRPSRVLTPVLLAVIAALAVAVWAARALHRWREAEELATLRATHTLAGNVTRYELRFEALGASRAVWVYRPPAYHREKERRYPVLYLLDGQQVFDGATAAVAGREWELDEAAEQLTLENRIEPLIAVAVESGGDRRVFEYTPRVTAGGEGGGLEATARMLRDELKPWVDANYRTRTGPQDTGIAGASLGALAALELALRHPDTFGRAAALSLPAGWDDGAARRTIEALADRPALRLWLDIGTREGQQELARVREVHQALLRKGWREGEDLRYLEAEGDRHDDAAWARRVPEMLAFLYPPTGDAPR